MSLGIQKLKFYPLEKMKCQESFHFISFLISIAHPITSFRMWASLPWNYHEWKNTRKKFGSTFVSREIFTQNVFQPNEIKIIGLGSNSISTVISFRRCCRRLVILPQLIAWNWNFFRLLYKFGWHFAMAELWKLRLFHLFKFLNTFHVLKIAKKMWIDRKFDIKFHFNNWKKNY